MARRKSIDDEIRKNSGSVGYSDKALKALYGGTYDKLTKRNPTSMDSREQVNIANPLPALNGISIPNNIEWQSRSGRARQYQQNIANEEKKFRYNDAIAARNTLDKKDQNYIDGLVSRLGNADSVRKYLGDKKATEWEQKYGKTIDQIYDDYVADQDNAKIREGKEHPIRSTIATTLGEFGKPLQAIPHVVSNLIDPDSAIAKGSEKARAEYSDQLKRLKAGVKENLGDTGDKVYDTATQVGGRMLLNTAGNILGGPLGSAILTGLADYSDQMDELNLRPGMSGRQKAASALAHGTVEGAGNAITRGLLDGLPAVSGVGGRLLNVGKGAGNAAAENAISEAVEMGLDTLINGENSERELNKAIYMSQGMSEAEAEEQVQNDQWGRVKLAAGTGALFGGATKGLGEITDAIRKIPMLKGMTSEAVDTSNVDTSDIDTVINDATKQAETAQANIQNLADQIPEAENTTRVELPEKTKPVKPEIKPLEGAELEEAQKELESLDNRINALKNNIELYSRQKNNKGNTTKAAKEKIKETEAEIKKLEANKVDVTRRINGETKPVIEQLKNAAAVKDFKKSLNKIAKMSPENKGLAQDARAALDEYIETGDMDAFSRLSGNLSKINEYSRNIPEYMEDWGNNENGIWEAFYRGSLADALNEAKEIHTRTAATSAPANPELGDMTRQPSELQPSNTDPAHDLAWRYANAFSKADDYGYLDMGEAEVESVVEQMADDIAKGRDLTNYISGLEDMLDDVEDPEVKGEMQRLINDLSNIQEGKTTTSAPENPTLTQEVRGLAGDDLSGGGNEPPSGGDRVRSFSKRGSQDETLPEDIRNTLSEDYYKVVHNADVEARADSLFVPEDLTQTRSNLDRAVKAHDPASASLSYKLAKAYVDNGDYDAATDVLENVSAELTRMGQFTQAAKLAMLQNDPMAAMRSYMRDLEKLNEWGSKKYKDKWNKLELSEEDIDAISKIQKGDKDALNAITDQLNEKFARQIPANWWDKAVSASKTAMLLNLRTQSRNILANMATLPIRSASDRVSAVGQNIVHLLNPDMKVTQSLTGGTKEQKAIAEQIFEQNKAGILGENKMKDSVKSDILSQRQIFNDDAFATWVDNLTNGGIQKLNQRFGANGNKSTMETLQNLTYWLMGDIGDTPFVKKNFVNRLASYMKAQGINKIEDVPDDAIAIATQEALKATFKDDNKFTKALQGIKQKTGKFGEVALPFVKTPANLTMRAVDYSPAGLYNTFKKIRSGAEANAVIDELAKNITGTGMIYLGYKLAEKGLLSGSYSDDPDEAQFQRQQGMLENAIHIGDKYFTYDWTQPAATPLVLGQTIYEAVKASDKQNAEIKDIVNATVKGGLNVADTVINSSPLQSLADIMGGDEYSDKSVAKNVANEIIEFPQRFVPSVLGATARTIDPVMRDTYIDDDSFTGTIGNNLRQMEAKIPFLSKRLPVSYDTWGNPRTRSDSVGEAFVAQMVNPGTMGNKNETPLDAEIQRLFDATGNNAVFPVKAGRSLDLGNDGNLTLTNRQHSEYQKALGQKSYSYVEALTNSDEYKNLSDDEKAALISKAYKLSNAMVKEEMFKHTTTDDKKLKEVARTGDANAVAKYLLDKNKADNLGMSIDKYQEMEKETPGSAETWIADKQKAIDTGFTKKDGSADVEAYENAVNMFGNNIPAIQGYSEYKKQGFTKNAEKIPYLMDNDLFSDEEKGMILAGTKEYADLGNTAKGAYDVDGYAGVYYYWLLKQLADADGNGSVKKAEKTALLNSDNPYVTQLSDDMYYYLAGAKW